MGQGQEGGLSGQRPVDPREFKAALSRFASGVTIVTAITSDGQPCGVTATSFTSLSLDPPLVQWSLRNEASLFSVFSTISHFAISILSDNQQAISERFGAHNANRFSGLDVELGLHELPLIVGALAWLECELCALHPGGDHTILVGRVVRARYFDRKPLLHWLGRYIPIKEQLSS